MVYFMPNLSNPRPINYAALPILLLEYQVSENGSQRHHSFGFKAASIQMVELRTDGASTALPAIVWSGEGSVLCLAFNDVDARAQCLQQVAQDAPFGLSLERELHASFLLREPRTSSPSDGVELYQVCGAGHTIMSRRVGQRGFVVVDQTWSTPPQFFPFDFIGPLGSSGNWAFVLTRAEAEQTRVCIIECSSPSVARDVVSSLKQRAQRQISAGGTILSVTIHDIGRGELAIRSHSESGQPKRVPFQTAWALFHKRVKGRKA